MRYAIISEAATVEKILEVNRRTQQKTFPIVGKRNQYLGYITVEDVEKYKEKHQGDLSGVTSFDVFRQALAEGYSRTARAHINEPPEAVLMKIKFHNLGFIPVVNDEEVLIGTADKDSLSVIINA